MCIAIYGLKGTEVPAEDILRTCFVNNSDGAGFCFNTDNGKVQIVKGFMTWESFISAFREYNTKYNFKDRGLLIHFRIATHGSTNPGNCHPFPISSNPKHLKKPKFISDYACVHNGIITLTASEKSELSDTGLFVKDYLAKIASNKGWFYNPKNTELIYELIASKMAVLNGNGEIIATKGFHQGDDGNFYSNNSYKSIYHSLYSWDFDDYLDIFSNERNDCELECPLMRLKQDEILYYDDGKTEEYESGYHNLYSHYITKEGDIYADYADCCYLGRVPMDKLTYLGSGMIVSSRSPINIVSFRNDVTGYI